MLKNIFRKKIRVVVGWSSVGFDRVHSYKSAIIARGVFRINQSTRPDGSGHKLYRIPTLSRPDVVPRHQPRALIDCHSRNVTTCTTQLSFSFYYCINYICSEIQTKGLTKLHKHATPNNFVTGLLLKVL